MLFFCTSQPVALPLSFLDTVPLCQRNEAPGRPDVRGSFGEGRSGIGLGHVCRNPAHFYPGSETLPSGNRYIASQIRGVPARVPGFLTPNRSIPARDSDQNRGRYFRPGSGLSHPKSEYSRPESGRFSDVGSRAESTLYFRNYYFRGIQPLPSNRLGFP